MPCFLRVVIECVRQGVGARLVGVGYGGSAEGELEGAVGEEAVRELEWSSGGETVGLELECGVGGCG